MSAVAVGGRRGQQRLHGGRVGLADSGSPVVDMIDVMVAHPLGVLDGHRLHDHAAHRGAHDVGPLDAEVVEQADGVGGHVGQLVGHGASPASGSCRSAAPP